jgi:hypothetical protein
MSHGPTGVQTTGNDSIVNLDNVFMSFYQTALKTNNAGTASHIRLSSSTLAQNTNGIDTSLGGTVDSFQGNSLIASPGVFSSTTIKQ